MARSEKNKTTNTPVTNSSNSILEAIEKFGIKHQKKLLPVFTGLAALFALLLFNARISEANDDAFYLEDGWRCVDEFPKYFHVQNAPLYTLLLATLIKLLGFKLFLFKITNVLFVVASVFVFFKAFVNRIQYVVFIPVMLFISCNSLIMYYASMTYTESLFLLLQSVFLFFTLKMFDDLQSSTINYKNIIYLCLSLFLVTTCKNIAIVAIPTLLLCLVILKKWKQAVFIIGGYVIIKIIYETIIKLVWNASNQFSGQTKILLLKDPYDKDGGNVDFTGLITRLIENTDIYLGKRFLQLLGWKNENSTDTIPLIALLLVLIMAYAFYKSLKLKNNLLLFLSLYVGSLLTLTFTVLQTRWDQPRVLMIGMPVLLIVLLHTCYQFTKTNIIGSKLYLALIIIMSGSLLMQSIKKSSINLPILKKNIGGDMYYGYTPDWQNFLKCSKWCKDNLATTDFVASRKAPMSFIYANGKKFFHIYNVIKKDPTTNQSHPDSALTYFKQNKVTHIMVGSLRMNPNMNTGDVINTIHNIIEPIMTKYPNKLQLIHTEGVSEEAYVFKINY